MDAADAESLQQWLETLSLPDLDLLISLRNLASTRAHQIPHHHYLAQRFHLRTLRALGIVLLEYSKHRLRETSADQSIADRLALLSDSYSEFKKSEGDDSKVLKPNEDQQMPIGVKERAETEFDARVDDFKVVKPNEDQQMPIGVKERIKPDTRCHEEDAQCRKKRKTSCGDITMTNEQTDTEVLDKAEGKSLHVTPL